MWVLYDDELDQIIILAKSENITRPNLIDMFQLVLRDLQSTFPYVETILRIYSYLTIPVSNASGKSSFSVIKRLKH